MESGGSSSGKARLAMQKARRRLRANVFLRKNFEKCAREEKLGAPKRDLRQREQSVAADPGFRKRICAGEITDCLMRVREALQVATPLYAQKARVEWGTRLPHYSLALVKEMAGMFFSRIILLKASTS